MKHPMVVVTILLLANTVYAIEPRKADREPCVKICGDEVLDFHTIFLASNRPYTIGREDTVIGTTSYDYQANGSFGQRIMLDSRDQAHINWMWCDFPLQIWRYCAWNARFNNGTYCGARQASHSWSGYVQLDITRDANPDSQRTIYAYHYNAGSGFFSWIDIDAWNLCGGGINYPKTPGVSDHIWPYVAATNNGNIILATGDYNEDMLHLYLTTDEGETWTSVADFDSCACLSQFVRSSINPGSNRVVFVWTQFITDTVAGGQMDNDVWYMLSEDGGITWSRPLTITNYQPTDSVRAYSCVNALFDLDDRLHIAWAGRKVTDHYYEASKIFHWDELHDSITVVSDPSMYYSEPGGWWIESPTGGDYGAWRLPADQPQLSASVQNNALICLWGGNDNYNDHSAGGYINGEIFGSMSYDGGLTWTQHHNFTNTRTPDAPPGVCMDEDYFTVYPRFYNVSTDFYGVYTYVLDKDAGALPQNEGTLTNNPVYCYYYFWQGGQEEDSKMPQYLDSPYATIFNDAFFFNFDKPYRIFDITGRQVHTLDPAPGIYFIEVDGTTKRKIVKIK